MLISTTNDVPGHQVIRHVALVRGITVRSRSIIGNFFSSFFLIFGGRQAGFVRLCDRARQEALDHMIEHAKASGANAIIAMRYDANEIATGVNEVLAYGTAVVVQPN